MRLVGNIIWFVFGGIWLAGIWLIGAALFAVSIIGLPISRAAVEMAKLSAFPFGKDVVHIREIDAKGVTALTAATGTIGFVANVAWLCSFGWILFLAYLVAGVINCFFIITIPFGIQSFKLAGLSLWPVGRRVVSKEFAHEVRRLNASNRLSKLRGGAVA
ncbi:hypothetical protein ASC97_29825 [Rhizobium sp. Root1203]|uniref:YccF family protein n=1 Tax=Rhizobium sp. Root1203 TaxID=1736427 RepID=UPI00070E85AD|nr:YccF family protein [Rhizobium sp. Root1203]KQV18302.1 hypothetical protein ASC97_29825 [Rhizobium sp. Root1203]